MRGWGLFFFLLFLFLILAVVGWVGFNQYKARKEGLTPPSLKEWKTYVPFMRASSSSSNYPAPRRAGPLEWIRERLAGLRNKRTARGAYEDATGEAEYGTARRGRTGAEDDAWDTRVGNEDAYGPGQGGYSGYEEQELGLASTPGLQSEGYGGARGGGDYLGPNTNYSDVDVSRGRPGSSRDPFSDQNEAPSLRSVSPRPEGHAKNESQDSDGGNTSPISTRKSVFRERI